MAHESDALEGKLERLHGDVGEIKTALGKLSDAIIKLALIEERQSATGAALERAFKALERLETRLANLELANVSSKRTSGWIDKLVTAAVGILVLLVLKKTGIM